MTVPEPADIRDELRHQLMQQLHLELRHDATSRRVVAEAKARIERELSGLLVRDVLDSWLSRDTDWNSPDDAAM